MAVKHIAKSNKQESLLIKESPEEMPLVRKNFILMIIAGFMIVLGFALMAGGSTDWETFNEDIFSARRIVVGPTIAFLGFVFMGFGIMYSPRKNN
ncbi:MAG: DUF3098 domain-containing protein [Muribaculum sp.]|nr:DUF3098 domain-containing protein [Muribaculum sp.]